MKGRLTSAQMTRSKQYLVKVNAEHPIVRDSDSSAAEEPEHRARVTVSV